MTVTFFSNFLLLHQTPFCEAMVNLIDDGFRFVATEKVPQERLDMGYEDMSHTTPYAINTYDSPESLAEAQRLADESDVVILGDAPTAFVEERLKRGKLTFRYTERIFKQGRWRILDPRVALSLWRNDIRFRKKPMYLLCASAYTAPDYHFIGCYKGKAFKWGYFPEVKTYDENELMNLKSEGKLEILWVARMIKLKHPEFPVMMANKLRECGYDFHLTMIGEGHVRPKLEAYVKEHRLQGYVTFKNFMPQADVRRHMEQANIFLFTSNREEGWGAVLNEAMNSGCAVVANDEIGSVPFLVKEGENGLTYHKRLSGLTAQVRCLLDSPATTESLGRSAYRTLRDTWNAEEGSKRLVALCESLLSKENIRASADGPISFS